MYALGYADVFFRQEATLSRYGNLTPYSRIASDFSIYYFNSVGELYFILLLSCSNELPSCPSFISSLLSFALIFRTPIIYFISGFILLGLGTKTLPKNKDFSLLNVETLIN